MSPERSVADPASVGVSQSCPPPTAMASLGMQAIDPVSAFHISPTAICPAARFFTQPPHEELSSPPRGSNLITLLGLFSLLSAKGVRAFVRALPVCQSSPPLVSSHLSSGAEIDRLCALKH